MGRVIKCFRQLPTLKKLDRGKRCATGRALLGSACGHCGGGFSFEAQLLNSVVKSTQALLRQAVLCNADQVARLSKKVDERLRCGPPGITILKSNVEVFFRLCAKIATSGSQP